MNKTRVVHCKREPYDVYIGRPSEFGNLFHIGAEYGNREEVIAAFKNWFYTCIDIDSDFEKAIRSLKGKVLGCWCKPKACHGDIIVEYLEG